MILERDVTSNPRAVGCEKLAGSGDRYVEQGIAGESGASERSGGTENIVATIAARPEP